MKTVHNYEPFRKNQPINESVHKTFRAGHASVHASVLSNVRAVFKRFDIQELCQSRKESVRRTLRQVPELERGGVAREGSCATFEFENQIITFSN